MCRFFRLYNPSFTVKFYLLSNQPIMLHTDLVFCFIHVEYLVADKRVTLIVAFVFLPQNFGKVAGTYDDISSVS